MKRIPQLRALSEDHHHGLVLALKAKNAAVEKGTLPVADAWRLVRKQFDAELEPHFRVEEDLLVPAMRAAGEAEMMTRLLAEHAALRAFVLPGAEQSPEALGRFGALLEAHIRFEEREVFEKAQKLLTEDTLNAIAEAGAPRISCRLSASGSGDGVE